MARNGSRVGGLGDRGMKALGHRKGRGLAAVGLALLATAIWWPGSAVAAPPTVFEGRPTLSFVYETTPNPPRHLGVGTAIDWDRPGLTLELLERVGARLKVNLSFRRMPWKRCLLLLETGEADGVFHASYVAGREAIGVYPKTADGRPDPRRSIFFQSYSLFVAPGSPVTWDGQTIGGLGGRPVGATAGYSVIKDLERMGVTVDPGRIPELNFAKLLEGRIAAYAELTTMAKGFIRRDPEHLGSIMALEPPLVSKAYYLILSHQFVERDRALAEAVWNTIATVRESEEFRRLEDDYAGKR